MASMVSSVEFDAALLAIGKGAAGMFDGFTNRRLVRAAQLYLLERHGSRPPACRFDVVAFGADGTIDWIRDAFAVD